MIFDKRTLEIIGIMAMSFWLSFLFIDGVSSAPVASKGQAPTQQVQEVTSDTGITIADQTEITTQTDSGQVDPQHSSASLLSSFSVQGEAINPPTKQQVTEDVRALETLYEKNGDTQILVTLLQHLAANYQFDEANLYLQKLMQISDYERLLDPNVIIYILMHGSDISYGNPQSITSILPLIAQYRQEGLLTQDDESLYNGLIAIRSKKYADASKNFVNIKTATYQPLIQSYHKALNDYSGSKNAPAYYQDALVALSMLKNGYFSIAKNLSIGALMKDEEYILPYQILAYANFLSNDFDVSAEYFLKLADFDIVNKQDYLFLVGVSYYRIGKYDQATLYLNQVTDPLLLTDVYRYQLLSSLGGGDMDAALRIWQKLLGQGDLQQSDFALFFKNFYYIPYGNGQPFTLYRDNSQLATSYGDSCIRLFSGSDDVCVYGDVGQELANQHWTGIVEKLLYVSSTYHQSYLFHILGDYYLGNKEYSLAKNAYSQALSICTDTNEEVLLKDKLQKLLNKE